MSLIHNTADLNTNSSFAPYTANANLKFTKTFSFGKEMRLRFYANILNLFNKDNYNTVYGITGNPFDSGEDLDFTNSGYVDPNLMSVYSQSYRDPSNVAAGRTYSFGLTYIW